jgi:hypothetical protein
MIFFIDTSFPRGSNYSVAQIYFDFFYSEPVVGKLLRRRKSIMERFLWSLY